MTLPSLNSTQEFYQPMLLRGQRERPAIEERASIQTLRSACCLKICCVLLLTMCVLTGSARPLAAEWQTFGVSDGLADRSVWAILKDSSGNLWFGTRGGVTRHDGGDWKTFTTGDGLSDDHVCAIIEDKSGNFWFGTLHGVSHYDGVSWTTFTTADGLAGDWVQAVLQDGSGNLWFGTQNGGVSRYDGVSWITYTVTDGLADNDVCAIIEDESGDLWFGTHNGGVSRYDGVSWTTYTEADGLAHNYVRAILQDSSGRLWFGTYNGVSCYDGASWRSFWGYRALALFEDRSGNLWCGTAAGGVSRYDGVSWTTFTTADGLAGTSVYAVSEDDLGNLWFGTLNGVSLYDGVSWRTFSTADGLTVPKVDAILEDSSGNLWFGTWGGGAIQFDGVNWTSFTTANGLVADEISAVAEDRLGNIWFGSWGSGVSRYDGTSWTTFTTADGLAGDWVHAIFQDSFGNMWFGTSNGLSLYDGVGWTTFTTTDGLAHRTVYAIAEDGLRDLWFGTLGGVSRYDGTSWTTFTEADGLAHYQVSAVCVDDKGALWFGTHGGVSRYDGTSWTTFTTADGLADNDVRTIIEDGSGNMWAGAFNGVSLYGGVAWTTFTTTDGLGDNDVTSIVEDRRGNIWFGHHGISLVGATVHHRDQVPPQTIILARPPELSANKNGTISYTTAYRESRDVHFSHSFDGSPWSQWTLTGFWVGHNLSDGPHVFAVRALDRAGNVDSTAAVCTFEIDTTPPAPVIVSPVHSQAVRDSVLIQGTAYDMRFEDYRVEVRSAKGDSWSLLAESWSHVTDGVLGGWNTLSVPDGDYELRLSVSDTLGLTGIDLVRVVVDNEAPWAHETEPAIVNAATGGDVYTTKGEVHLYFPPHAFETEAEVKIDEVTESVLPDTLEDGATRILAGYAVSWYDVDLQKAAILDLSYDGSEATAEQGSLVIYALGADSTWQRLGGTVDASVKRISTPITQAAYYSVYLQMDVPGGAKTLSSLSITPRVFSPQGSFAARTAAIGFTIGQAGPVTVKVYNRAGRLVRQVESGKYMTAGANLVRWDGRDLHGKVVEDGVYLVTVEALGRKQVKPVAVVR